MSKKSSESVKTLLNEINAKIEAVSAKLDAVLQQKSVSVQSTLDNLPWKAYRNGSGSWIFADTRGAEKLVERLKSAEGNVIFNGAFRYSLSKDGRFIRRNDRQT